MKKIIALALTLVALLSLTACSHNSNIGTTPADTSNDAYALVITSTESFGTFNAFNRPYGKAPIYAAENTYQFYMEDNEIATVMFKCTACKHFELLFNITAPQELFFICECTASDTNPAMPKALAINLILGSPPAEEATED